MPIDLPARLAVDLDGSFEELVRRHQHVVYTTALRLVPTRADAEELAQEAFIRAYRALKRYPQDQVRSLRLRPWLARITVNLCRNAARDRSRRPQTTVLHDAGEEHARAHSTDDGVGDGERWEALVVALPARQRAAVVLRHVQGMPYAEIAAALGVPVGTVKSDVHRGLAHLAAQEER